MQFYFDCFFLCFCVSLDHYPVCFFVCFLVDQWFIILNSVIKSWLTLLTNKPIKQHSYKTIETSIVSNCSSLAITKKYCFGFSRRGYWNFKYFFMMLFRFFFCVFLLLTHFVRILCIVFQIIYACNTAHIFSPNTSVACYKNINLKWILYILE